MYTIGIDIGGTNFRIGLIDEEYNLSCFEKISQGDLLNGDSPSKLAEFIKDYIKRNNVEKEIAAVCVGFPATVDKTRSIVLNAPNIMGFNNVNVKQELSKRLDFPVFIEKDVNILITYDLYQYNIPVDCTVAAYYVGTGLGNAIYINNKLISGDNGVAGELGHIPAMNAQHTCNCGNKGCVEPLVGGMALKHLIDTNFKETHISDIFTKHGNDPLIDQYLENLAVPLAAEINIIDPTYIIIGGGVVGMKDFPRERLERHIRNYVRKPLPEKNIKFIFTDSGENSVIGAGIYSFKKLQ